MPRGIKKTDRERRDEYEHRKEWLRRRNIEKPLKSPCLEGRRKHMWVRIYETGCIPLMTGSFKLDADKCSWCGKTRKQAKNERKRRKINEI